ncbi:MAG: hypothetical protein A2V70_06265 [Planctomycetes bacterium RBG_13_63_9]|nr:MAG: hypothetical protein A2V70_06265 [Planctomycetes bacterium RBG_13_63_9]
MQTTDTLGTLEPYQSGRLRAAARRPKRKPRPWPPKWADLPSLAELERLSQSATSAEPALRQLSLFDAPQGGMGVKSLGPLTIDRRGQPAFLCEPPVKQKIGEE